MGIDIATEYGYIVSDAEGTLELQRLDEIEKFPNDAAAAEQFKKDLSVRNRYAIECLVELIKDYGANNGEGRGGEPHDMDKFDIWSTVWNLSK